MPQSGSRLAVVLLTLIAPISAFAEETTDAEGRKIIYKQVTEIDLGGGVVTATMDKPTGSLVSDVRKQQFPPLTKLRTEFNAEMRSSAEEVK